MKYALTVLLGLSLTLNTARSQNFEFDQDFSFSGNEIGFDIAFSASTNGGNAGLGLKYGFNFGEYLIVGPSVRYERLWIKNQLTTQSAGYNMFGGGAFVHGRFFNALFLGAEFEMLRSPYQTAGLISKNTTWAPTLFLGGGFSMEFNDIIRLNAGIMYDLINADNSPFRSSYFMQKKTALGEPAGYLPIIYRIAFFIPLNN